MKLYTPLYTTAKLPKKIQKIKIIKPGSRFINR